MLGGISDIGCTAIGIAMYDERFQDVDIQVSSFTHVQVKTKEVGGISTSLSRVCPANLTTNHNHIDMHDRKKSLTF